MREQSNRVRVRLYPLRGCVSVTVCVLGFAENVVGSTCANLSDWEFSSVSVCPRMCTNMHAWRSDFVACLVLLAWGEGFASLQGGLHSKSAQSNLFYGKKWSAKAFQQFFHTKFLDRSTHSVHINAHWHATGWTEWVENVTSTAA